MKRVWLGYSFLFFLAPGFCGVLCPVAQAQEAAASTQADEERYQANLRRWQSMSEEEREAVRQKAAAMPDEEKSALKEKVQQYRSLPEPERQALKENFKRYRALPQEQREALERKQREFRQLPPEKREQMRRDFREQRRAAFEQAGPSGERLVAKPVDMPPKQAAAGSPRSEKPREDRPLLREPRKTFPDEKSPSKVQKRNDQGRPYFKDKSSQGPRHGGGFKEGHRQKNRLAPRSGGPGPRRK
jgi:hypothetical protein